MKLIVKIGIIFFLLFGIVAVTHTNAQFLFFGNPMVGKIAKDFTLKSTSGDMVKFSDVKGQNKAILFFWATWCPHCRTSLADLKNKTGELESKGVKLFLIDIGESGNSVKKYLDRNKIGLSVLLDQSNSVAQSYNVMGVPTYVYVNNEGKVTNISHDIPKNYEDLFEL